MGSPDHWKSNSPFVKIFGESSTEMARVLLTAALKEMRDSEVKFEIGEIETTWIAG